MRLRAYASIYTRVLGKKLFGGRCDGITIKRNALVIKDYFLTEGRKIYRLLQAVYTNEYRRLQLFSKTLASRFPVRTPYQNHVLSMFGDKPSTISRLLYAHLNISQGAHTTNDAEIRLLAAYLAYHTSKRSARWLRSRSSARHQSAVRNRELEMAHTTRFLSQKIDPLEIETDPKAPRRVNILIPTIDLKVLFGGYIGKLNLAKRFIDCGYNVRILIVDECDFVPSTTHGTLPSSSPLAADFAKIEFQYCYDRNNRVLMNPEDRVVATTWWTAHVANAAVKNLSHPVFIYFIQEYEPFTFPMGTLSALANQSYRFNHFPLFSSTFLREYFEINRLGVYGAPTDGTKPDTAVFENAIAAFSVDRETLVKRPYKRLLFYARPEPHASRNMFEMGVLALNDAITKGVFDDSWEFWAAGTATGELPLAKGKSLKMIGKLDLDAYQKTLPRFDLGMSLMYTPHPSLVPIEMAAAGLVVVTTTCMNKTADKLQAISSNILGVEATIEAISDGLAGGVAKAGRIDDRLKGAGVNWPKTWHESLPTGLIHKMAG
jgi:hypothetical protein